MKIIRISGHSYVLRPFSIQQTEKILSLLTKYEANEIKDIPKVLPLIVSMISTALSRSLVKSYFLRKRLKNANINSLIEAMAEVIENIPTSEFYAINQISTHLNKLLIK